jgi:hypothetical protein
MGAIMGSNILLDCRCKDLIDYQIARVVNTYAYRITQLAHWRALPDEEIGVASEHDKL